MKYKDNEISYSKAVKLLKRNKLPKKFKRKNIDTIYLDSDKYINGLIKKLKNENNIIINTNKIKMFDKDIVSGTNYIYIEDTNASNIYFLNESVKLI